MSNCFYVYILTTFHNTALYTGVTNNLRWRVQQHKEGKGSAFTSKYKIYKLVFFGQFQYILNAIARENQIKGGSKRKKIALIEGMNPDRKELEAV